MNIIILLQILKAAPHLSSIRIDFHQLISLFNNHELDKYLNIMIKTLDLTSAHLHLSINPNEMEELCPIFSNMEMCRCGVGTLDNLLLIVNALSKLSNLTLFVFRSPDGEENDSWLRNYRVNWKKYSFTIECE